MFKNIVPMGMMTASPHPIEIARIMKEMAAASANSIRR
jgi:hypothetical protein